MKRRIVILQFFVIMLGVLAGAVLCVAQVQAPKQAQTPAKEPAQPWKLYLESESKRYYYDPASIEVPEKRVVRVWERITQAGKGGEEKEKLQSLIELDCSSSRYRIIAWKEYDPETGKEKPEVRNDNEPWEYFSRESILGVLYDNVCWEKTPSGKIEKRTK